MTLGILITPTTADELELLSEMMVIHLILSCAKGNLNDWCIPVRERNPTLKICHHMAVNLSYLSSFTVLVKCDVLLRITQVAETWVFISLLHIE